MNTTSKISLGYSISSIGNNLRWLAVPLLIYHLSGSGQMMMMFVLAGAVGDILGSFSGGIISEHMDRKKCLVWIDVGCSVLTASYLLINKTWLPIILPLSLIMQTLSSAGSVINSAFVDDVRTEAKVRTAFAKIDIGIYTSAILATLGGGLLLTFTSFSVVFILDSASYLACAAILMTLKSPHKDAPPKGLPQINIISTVQGYIHILREYRGLLLLGLFAISMSFAAYCVPNSLVIYFLKENYHASDLVISFWLTSSKIAFLLASMYLSWGRMGHMTDLSLTLIGALIITITYAISPWMFSWVLFSLIYMGNQIGFQFCRLGNRSEVMEAVPAHLKSRALAARNILIDVTSLVALTVGTIKIESGKGKVNFLLASLCMLLGLILMWMYKKWANNQGPLSQKNA
jgi:Na+/melibiose symporter-like transporter